MKLSPAAKVAAGATAVIAVVYVLGVIVLNLLVSSHLTGQNDQRLAERLAAVAHDPAELSQPADPDGSRPAAAGDAADAAVPTADDDAAPVFVWAANTAGTVTEHSLGAPALPAGLLTAHPPRDGLAFTARLGSAGAFRLKLTRQGSGWLIAGQSLSGDAHTERLLLYAELIAGPFVLVAMFFGSLVVGLRALAPVEQSRRRQLEFTADASHELRTPLSVIRAEADVALSSPREAAEYRDALTRIQGESRRLRQLVDDMLWLARFDSRPPPPGDEPVDLATLAQACADRFRAVGPAVTADVGGPTRARADQRAAGVDRPAGRRADGQCLPVRGPRRAGQDRRPGPRQPGQPHRGGQRARDPRRGTAAAVRPVPPHRRPRPGHRPGPGHRRLDRALDRREVAGRGLPAGRGADERVLAALPAAPPVGPALVRERCRWPAEPARLSQPAKPARLGGPASWPRCRVKKRTELSSSNTGTSWCRPGLACRVFSAEPNAPNRARPSSRGISSSSHCSRNSTGMRIRAAASARASR